MMSDLWMCPGHKLCVYNNASCVPKLDDIKISSSFDVSRTHNLCPQQCFLYGKLKNMVSDHRMCPGQSICLQNASFVPKLDNIMISSSFDVSRTHNLCLQFLVGKTGQHYNLSRCSEPLFSLCTNVLYVAKLDHIAATSA